MPFPVQTGRFAAMVRRLFNLQGHVGLQAIDDVFLVLPVTQPDDETLAAERGEVRIAEGVTSAAVAGQFSFTQVTNSDNSGKLAIIEEVWVHGATGASAEFACSITQASVSGSAPRMVLDTRAKSGLPGVNQSPTAAGTVLINTGASGSPLVGSQLLFGQFANTNHCAFRPGAVLEPGFRFAVFCQTVNTELHTTYVVRVRDVTPQELFLG